MLHHWDIVCRFHHRNDNIPRNITKICVPNEIHKIRESERKPRRWRTTLPITVNWKTNRYSDYDEVSRRLRCWDQSLPLTINWNMKKKESHKILAQPTKEQRFVKSNTTNDNRLKTTTETNMNDVSVGCKISNVSIRKASNIIAINVSAETVPKSTQKKVSVDLSKQNHISGSNLNDPSTDDCLIQQRNDQISIDTNTLNITIQKTKDKEKNIQSILVPKETTMTLNNTGLIAVIERNNSIALENEKFGEFYYKDRQDIVTGNTTNIQPTSNVDFNFTKRSNDEITNHISKSDKNIEGTLNSENIPIIRKVNYTDRPTKSTILDSTKQYENISDMLKRYSNEDQKHILLYDNINEGVNFYEKHRSNIYRFTDKQLRKHKEISEKVKGTILPSLDNDNEEDDDSGCFDEEDDLLVINHENKNEMLIFIENIASFPPIHYLYTVSGYPDYCMGRCPCSNFYHK